MKLDELYDYKNQVIGDLLTNENILKLLNDDFVATDNPKSLVFSQVFPYEYVPDTIEHGQTFICCDVDIQKSSGRSLFYAPYLYVWVFSHKSKLRLPTGGVRVDKLCSEIVDTINGSRKYGLGELEFFSSKRFAPINDYLGKMLVFHALDFNRTHPTGKEVPSKRKA